MSMPTAVLILPGIGGSGPEHWQTAWEQDIPGARRVSVPDWDRPVCAHWTAALEAAVADAAASGSRVAIVAHSLGCLQLVHWAKGRRAGPVQGALLVAPPDPDAASFPPPPIILGFRPLPLDRLPFPSVLVASHDDPYAGFDFASRAARAWGSRLIDLGRRGHINAGSGLGTWPEGRAWLDELRAGPS
jgi:predicted alpha/beta hydrolase family esterase